MFDLFLQLWESGNVEQGKARVGQILCLVQGGLSAENVTLMILGKTSLGIQQWDLFLLLSSSLLGGGARQLQGRLMGIKELSSANVVQTPGVPPENTNPPLVKPLGFL